MNRSFWCVAHRYAGLTLALFVSVAGLTGSLLAFTPELERAISPQLFPAAPPGAQRLGLADLLEHAQALAPQAVADGVYLGDAERARVNMSPRNDPASGKPYALGFNELFLNPYTGAELGRSTWGEITQGWHNLMPLVLDIHYALMAGTIGMWVMGLAALLWTLDGFVGLYLTLPARAPGSRSGWQRWRAAWGVKRGARGYRLHFDLHRAGGLWLWGVLTVFAWSGVYMNLSEQVYHPVMSHLAEFKHPDQALPLLKQPITQPLLDWRAAQQRALELMAQQARLHGFRVGEPVRFYLDRNRGVYFLDVRTSLDFQDKRSATTLYFNAHTGDFRLLLLPHGQYSGNTIANWLVALHEANVFGLPFKIFVSCVGILIVMLSVTGVYIWLKKRRARSTSAQRRPLPSDGETA